MTLPRIHFVNRFYWPEEPATAQLLTDLASGLAARGWKVSVITSRPKNADSLAHETKDSVTIERVWSTRLGQRSLIARMLDFASFYVGAAVALWRRVQRGDIVVALTDPPLIGVLAGWISAWRGAHLVHWVQDIYPEIAVEVTGHRALLAARPWRNRAWRRAVACVVPGADMATVLADAGVGPRSLIVQPNWAPVGLTPPKPEAVSELRREWGLEGKFVIAYSGNLGRVHDLNPILEVAAALRNEPDFVVVFIGGGAQRATVEAAVQARSLTNVRFLPAQPRERLVDSLGVGDVHFVTLRPGADRWVFPSKLYGIAAVGRPTLFVGAANCEIARVVRDREIGASFTGKQVSEIVAQLREWRADSAKCAPISAAARAFSADGAAIGTQMWHNVLTAKLAEVATTS